MKYGLRKEELELKLALLEIDEKKEKKRREDDGGRSCKNS